MDPRSKRIAVTGASGMVGTALVRALLADGHRVTRLVRDRRRAASGEGDIFWDPQGEEIDAPALEGLDAVVHLAGENLASGRWTAERKQRILRSRTTGTSLLARTLAELEHKPPVLVSASGINYYGDRGGELLDETAGSGEGFLADVCREWEAATAPAAQAGIRVVCLRFGVILSPRGGALAKMLPAFKLGLGGKIGTGDQYMSWIALDDAVAAIRHAIAADRLTGPVNAVAPHAVTNAEFTHALGRALHRPTVFRIPGAALKVGYGSQLVEETLLGGQNAVPVRLKDTGFQWAYPEIDRALHHALTG